MDDYNNPFSLSYYKKNKIDNKNTHNFNNTETMKPKYSTNEYALSFISPSKLMIFVWGFLQSATNNSNDLEDLPLKIGELNWFNTL